MLILGLRRAMFSFFEVASWQKSYVEVDDHKTAIKEFAEQSESYISGIIIILEIVNLAVCLIAIKYRSITKVIIWVEVTRNIANAFVPYEYGAFADTHSN